MPYYLVESFRNGLDRRRNRIATKAGALWTLQNAHVSPGGDIEKRLAFVELLAVPNTYGLAAIDNNLFVFGWETDGPYGTIPYNPSVPFFNDDEIRVYYVKLDRQFLDVLDWELFDGNLLVSVRGTDGVVYRYYNGALMTDGYGSIFQTFKNKVFSVDGTGTIRFSALNNPKYWQPYLPSVDTIQVTPATLSDFMEVSDPNYTQYLVKVTATMDTATAGLIQVAGTPQPFSLTYDKSTLINGESTWARMYFADNPNSAFVANVNYTSDVSAWVYVTFTAAISEISGMLRIKPGFPYTIITNNPSGPVNPGEQRIYHISHNGLPNLRMTPADFYFVYPGSRAITISDLSVPARTIPDPSKAVESGAGFINVSGADGNSMRIHALESYYDQLAFFGEYAIQFWQFQSDPKASQLVQILHNTGTFAPQSPQQFGNGDVLYLATSGIRSLKARTNSDAAGVTDIGSAIDALVQDKLLSQGRGNFRKAFALVHPREGRFWMVMNDEIYVLSLFPGPDVSAWSVYKNDWSATAGTPVGQQIALRTEDKIYLYGGRAGSVYGNYPVIIETPYFTADKPANFKNYMGLDLVGEGTWTVDFSLDPRHPDDYERAGIYDGSTLTQARMALRGHSPVIGLRLTNQDTSDARLSQLIYHYEDSYTS